jgi:hypothetical protein
MTGAGAFILAAYVASILVASASAAPAPFIGTVAASLSTWDDFALVFYAANGNTKMITNLTTVGGVLPMESAYIAHLNAVAFITIGVKSAAVIVSETGAVLLNATYSNVVLTNIQYDVGLKAIYLVGYVPAQSKNFLWQLFPNGTLTQIVALPGIVQTSLSTYCQKSHTFFATVQTNSKSLNGLIKIDTQGKTVSPVINLDDDIEMLFWDYTAAIMYSMVATETQGAVLVTTNVNTGKRNSTIGAGFNNLSASANNGAGAAFNIQTKVITGSFIEFSNPDLPPFWVTLDTQTGKFTSKKYEYGYAINIRVNAPQ